MEAVILAWLAYAGSETERITAGILMVLVFLALIGVIGWIEFIRRPGQLPRVPDNVGLPRQEIERVQREPDEHIAAPDGSYVIKRPPPGWTVLAPSAEALIKEKIGDISGLILPAVSSILRLECGAPLSFTPQPDRMRMNGRRIPILLSEMIGRELRIITLRRRQPPLYIERTLYDAVLTLIAFVVQQGFQSVASITPGKLPKTNRDAIIFEVTQEFENIVLGDREQDVVRINQRITAIRGDLYDYVFLAINLRIGRGVDPAAERVDTEIGKLIDSFRLLSVADPVAEARKDSESADRDFDKYLSTYGPKWFEGQFKIAAAQLEEMDLNSAPGIARAVALLRPFRTFVKMLHGADFDPSGLWTALDQAEHGDTRPLRDYVHAILAPPPADSAPAIAPSTH